MSLSRVVCALAVFAVTAGAKELRVVSWCAQNPTPAAARAVTGGTKVSVWVLTRASSTVPRFALGRVSAASAHGLKLEDICVHGSEVNGIRTYVVCDPGTVRIKATTEVREAAIGNAPPPLAVECEAAGVRFIVLACDFAGGRAVTRRAQALAVESWVKKQTRPVVIAGAVQPNCGDDACDALGVFQAKGHDVVGRGGAVGSPDAIVLGEGLSRVQAPDPLWSKETRDEMSQLESRHELPWVPAEALIKLEAEQRPAEDLLRALKHAEELAAKLPSESLAKEVQTRISELRSRLEAEGVR